MKTLSHSKPAEGRLQLSTTKPPRKASLTWQPQQSTLTREEIRAIILEQIG
ncbi:hypothetical protein HPT29_019540 [Microvirga terrae]|uniref:Uncharacterized protein n=1 Tax=Microvirga terrae TaxID=2740529 RepID=A0ABY5RN34_9HYPH|nr:MULTISPECIES: hypothetical protein [Microvirga]MBQ0823669.1 hypothetical protein [Microvirga sp. HBU67558]UVF18661.1 hypothetical protein HPT29_019540 [Microvirga terrae]